MKVKIKEFAATKGLSLYKLAQLLGLPQQTVYSWANGRTQPSWGGMDQLCTLLECTLNDLFEPEYREDVAPDAALRRIKLELQTRYEHYKRMVAGLEP